MSTRPEDLPHLLAPSLGHAAPAAETRRRPWRLGSQVYVAFFGGVLAATAIAYLNAQRLGMDQRRRLAVLGLGALGLTAGIAFAAIAAGAVDARTLRLVERGIGLVAFGGMYLLQRTPDRVHHFYGQGGTDEDYDSLTVPGIAAVVVGALIQSAIIFAVAG